MKYSLILTLLMLSLTSSAQQKYILYSIPTYDSLGNLYGTKREFDYPPTKEDSLQFEEDSRKYIKHDIDIIYKPKIYTPKKRKAIKRYKPSKV